MKRTEYQALKIPNNLNVFSFNLQNYKKELRFSQQWLGRVIIFSNATPHGSLLKSTHVTKEHVSFHFKVKESTRLCLPLAFMLVSLFHLFFDHENGSDMFH
jgi:hypothetical protein